MKSHTVKLGLLTMGLFACSLATYAQDKPDPSKMFKASDHNKDGVITLEEFKNTKRKNELSNEVIEKRFNRMDADKNGNLTMKEVKAHLEKTAKAKAKKEAK
ncbi:EF-hand domain-containing protein [Jejuia pallidilutea]|jgi:hypothetical protein|nr:EF-hand domain-containing protein [Jejuia pallidilutea]